MKAHKHTVLLVDDDEDYVFLAQRALSSFGPDFTVQVAICGDEAIDYLRGQGRFSDRKQYPFPSYILTDLKMNPGDGFHVLEFLKNTTALSVIPVVVLTDSSNVDDIRQAYLLGASAYLVKPVANSAFKTLLRKVHEFWAECEVPQVDSEGYALATDSTGRLGARYTKPLRPTTR